MIQIRRSGTVFSGSDKDLKRLRDEFNYTHCILLPNPFEVSLLEFIQNRIAQAEFYERVHEDIVPPAVDFTLRDDTTLGLLHFLVNDQHFFDMVQQITGFGPIGCFMGSVYRMDPRQRHYDSWHDDLIEHRILAMSINLSPDVYRGGFLQIRNRQSGQIVHEVANTGFGNSIIIKLAPDLEHCVSSVEGRVSKTAFAGWFKSEPDYHLLLQESYSKTMSHDESMKESLFRKPNHILTLDNQVSIAEGVIYRTGVEETSIFDIDTGLCYGLDAIGSRAWKLLAERSCLQAVFQSMAEEYDVSHEDLRQDIFNLVNELHAKGLIRIMD
jgi:hypothetical protein